MESIKNNDTGLLRIAAESPPPKTLAIIGGTRIWEKLPLISALIDKADTIILGGEIAYTFLAARGKEVGSSPVHKSYINTCKEILDKAEKKKVNILLPIDHIAAIKPEPNITIKMIREGENIPDNMTPYDLGFESIKRFTKEIESAQLVIFHGPLGVFEIDTFSAGTLEILKSIAQADTQSIIMGEKLVEAVTKSGVTERFSFVSKDSAAALAIILGKK